MQQHMAPSKEGQTGDQNSSSQEVGGETTSLEKRETSLLQERSKDDGQPTGACLTEGHAIRVRIFTEGCDTVTFVQGTSEVKDYEYDSLRPEATGELEIICDTCATYLTVREGEAPPASFRAHVEAAWEEYRNS